MKSDNFFAELKRRNVYKVAVAYAVVGWLSIQIATQVFPFFEIPNWAVRLVVLVIMIGFPIALVIAWAFELTPQGLKRTRRCRSTGASNQEIARVDLYRDRRAHCYRSVCSCSAATDFAAVARQETSCRHKSIAVLPLLNESGNPKDEYFSDGLSEELIAALGQIRELKVIGRSSSFRFKERKEDSRTIGEKLGVARCWKAPCANKATGSGSSPN